MHSPLLPLAVTPPALPVSATTPRLTLLDHLELAYPAYADNLDPSLSSAAPHIGHAKSSADDSDSVFAHQFMSDQRRPSTDPRFSPSASSSSTTSPSISSPPYALHTVSAPHHKHAHAHHHNYMHREDRTQHSSDDDHDDDAATLPFSSAFAAASGVQTPTSTILGTGPFGLSGTTAAGGGGGVSSAATGVSGALSFGFETSTGTAGSVGSGPGYGHGEDGIRPGTAGTTATNSSSSAGAPHSPLFSYSPNSYTTHTQTATLGFHTSSAHSQHHQQSQLASPFSHPGYFSPISPFTPGIGSVADPTSTHHNNNNNQSIHHHQHNSSNGSTAMANAAGAGTGTAAINYPIYSYPQPPPPTSYAPTPSPLDPASKTYSFVALPGNSVRKRPRRRYDEIERLYACNWAGCTKSYGTLNHLNAHVSMQRHGDKRHPSEFKDLRKQWRKMKKEQEANAAAAAQQAQAQVQAAQVQAQLSGAATPTSQLGHPHSSSPFGSFSNHQHQHHQQQHSHHQHHHSNSSQLSPQSTAGLMGSGAYGGTMRGMDVVSAAAAAAQMQHQQQQRRRRVTEPVLSSSLGGSSTPFGTNTMIGPGSGSGAGAGMGTGSTGGSTGSGGGMGGAQTYYSTPGQQAHHHAYDELGFSLSLGAGSGSAGSGAYGGGSDATTTSSSSGYGGYRHSQPQMSYSQSSSNGAGNGNNNNNNASHYASLPDISLNTFSDPSPTSNLGVGVGSLASLTGLTSLSTSPPPSRLPRDSMLLTPLSSSAPPSTSSPLSSMRGSGGYSHPQQRHHSIHDRYSQHQSQHQHQRGSPGSDYDYHATGDVDDARYL